MDLRSAIWTLKLPYLILVAVKSHTKLLALVITYHLSVMVSWLGVHCRIDKVTPGHCTPRHNRWCHIHSLIEPDWSDNSAAHQTLICDYDPFEPPIDVFDSWNSYADFVNADATLSLDICSHADTSITDV
eukprot:g77611.t1